MCEVSVVTLFDEIKTQEECVCIEKLFITYGVIARTWRRIHRRTGSALVNTVHTRTTKLIYKHAGGTGVCVCVKDS